jgi:uncharacterized protein YjbJ (UPF0337 family)
MSPALQGPAEPRRAKWQRRFQQRASSKGTGQTTSGKATGDKGLEARGKADRLKAHTKPVGTDLKRSVRKAKDTVTRRTPTYREAIPPKGGTTPLSSWSAKRQRQYEHIKGGLLDRGDSEDLAEPIAARSLNKERARAGEARGIKPQLNRRPIVWTPRRASFSQRTRRTDARTALPTGSARGGPLIASAVRHPTTVTCQAAADFCGCQAIASS